MEIGLPEEVKPEPKKIRSPEEIVEELLLSNKDKEQRLQLGQLNPEMIFEIHDLLQELQVAKAHDKQTLFKTLIAKAGKDSYKKLADLVHDDYWEPLQEKSAN